MTELPDGSVWIDAETKIADAPADHRDDLRLWLRLLTCTNLIETEIRRKLQSHFDFTLPRFDLLAQLDRAEDGLVLGEVSKRLMVSAGNVTAIVDRLIGNGHITRSPAPHDRRVQIIRMTPEGRRAFRAMAGQHGDWIGDMFDDLGPGDIEMLMGLLANLKGSVRRSLSNGGAS
ncbi:MarR family winged helix-turn-helix transcriptional regulator [Lichenifustis flavocetrariae]|uniref:MarR family winged helix-turn-helix transcriptional regulator n=1 Tax=Lichenifustis flavocetrariae TaxID=2949735 RepID=A0AA41Z663_9HYPH|nr:MarR family winged helix-turn-helix transcriptional regulator [Lichenifustis flavocetrariae]MCW6510002.1 MarR family winged helix-turn-helix transcriptional regulator [Lichenifustis flavocetrariae]